MIEFENGVYSGFEKGEDFYAYGNGSNVKVSLDTDYGTVAIIIKKYPDDVKYFRNEDGKLSPEKIVKWMNAVSQDNHTYTWEGTGVSIKKTVKIDGVKKEKYYHDIFTYEDGRKIFTLSEANNIRIYNMTCGLFDEFSHDIEKNIVDGLSSALKSGNKLMEEVSTNIKKLEEDFLKMKPIIKETYVSTISEITKGFNKIEEILADVEKNMKEKSKK